MIGLTDLKDLEDVQLFQTNGANHVFPKRFDIESFHAVVRDFLMKKKEEEKEEVAEKKEQEASLKLETSTHRQRKARRDVGSLRILVVDDSKATR